MSPRPDKSLYPNPSTSSATGYCFWDHPRWSAQHIQVHMTDGEIVVGSDVWEHIGGEMAHDQSWCPCTVRDTLHGQWDFLFGEEGSWETNDEGCRSVMNAICTFNYYKRRSWVPLPAATWPATGIKREKLPPGPPLSVSAFWGYPITNSGGEISFPLEVRTPKFEKQDVFGNTIIDRAKTATFPVNFRWFRFDEWGEELKSQQMYLADRTPCSTDYQDHEIWPFIRDVSFPTCTDTSVSYSTVWWALPFGKPANSTVSEPANDPTATESTKKKSANTNNSGSKPLPPTTSEPRSEVATSGENKPWSFAWTSILHVTSSLGGVHSEDEWPLFTSGKSTSSGGHISTTIRVYFMTNCIQS